MADAHVRNIEALEEFLRQLGSTQEKLTNQQEETRGELQRVTFWMEKEAYEYWTAQFQLAKRKWVEARENLLRCESVTRADDKPACSEQRKKLDKCTFRVQTCEKKLKLLKKFQMEWQQMLHGLQLEVQHLSDVVESRLPVARHHLDRLLEPLRTYATLKGTPGSSNASPSSSQASSSLDSGSSGSDVVSEAPTTSIGGES